jgi:hypothetical protein
LWERSHNGGVLDTQIHVCLILFFRQNTRYIPGAFGKAAVGALGLLRHLEGIVETKVVLSGSRELRQDDTSRRSSTSR